MKMVLVIIILLIVSSLLMIVCIAWTHAPFTFRDFLRDFLEWMKRN